MELRRVLFRSYLVRRNIQEVLCIELETKSSLSALQALRVVCACVRLQVRRGYGPGHTKRSLVGGVKSPAVEEKSLYIGVSNVDDDICAECNSKADRDRWVVALQQLVHVQKHRSEEHTSELQSLMRISYAVFCLKKKN